MQSPARASDTVGATIDLRRVVCLGGAVLGVCCKPSRPAHTLPQIWVALGDNLAAVAWDLNSFGPGPVSQGLVTAVYVGWNVVSAVLGAPPLLGYGYHGLRHLLLFHRNLLFLLLLMLCLAFAPPSAAMLSGVLCARTLPLRVVWWRRCLQRQCKN